MEVVHDLNLTANRAEVVAIVGRNGAGKTTALNAIAGMRFGRHTGTVFLHSRDISALTPEEIFRAGLALVPEGHRVFQALTVLENLRLGFFPWRNMPDMILTARLDVVYSLFPVLNEYSTRAAGQLSGGQQQMLSIGQALMSDPSVLLLDEPSSGLAPVMIDVIYHTIAKLRGDGRTVCIVEQNLDRALANSDRCYVVDGGRIARDGASSELASDDRVAEAIHGLRE
jgi:branched-chain amino acid transport system ATP-binding protein